MPETAPMTVALVEHHALFRHALARLIDGMPGYRCLWAFPSWEEGLRALARAVPQVLLLDIHGLGLPGSGGVRRFLDKYPDLRILLLAIYDEDDRIFEAIRQGAAGYLLKKTPPAKLWEALWTVRMGGVLMSPELAHHGIEFFRQTLPPELRPAALTPPEVRLLRWLAAGHSDRAAADRLQVTVHTLRHHLRCIYEKLHVHSKAEAVRSARKPWSIF